MGNGRSADEIAALLAADNVAPRVTIVARPGLADADEVLDDAGDDVGTVGALAPTAVVLVGRRPGGPAERARRTRRRAGRGQPAGHARPHAGTRSTVRTSGGSTCAPGPAARPRCSRAVAGERGARIVANEVQPHRTRLVEQALRAVPADAVEDVRTGDGRDGRRPTSPARTTGSWSTRPAPVSARCAAAPRRAGAGRPADLASLSALQRELLVSALQAVRPGGVVAYVTCSPHLVETQLVVKDAVRAAGRAGSASSRSTRRRWSAASRPAATSTSPTAGLDVQLWPHVHGTDAMHLTLLRRTG